MGTQKPIVLLVHTRILLENFSIPGWRTRNLWSNQNDNHTKNETSLENLKPAWFLNQFRQPFGIAQWDYKLQNARLPQKMFLKFSFRIWFI